MPLCMYVNVDVSLYINIYEEIKKQQQQSNPKVINLLLWKINYKKFWF